MTAIVPTFTTLLTPGEVEKFIAKFRALPTSVPDSRSRVQLTNVNPAMVERAVHVRNEELRSNVRKAYYSFAESYITHATQFENRHLEGLFELHKRYEETVNQLEVIYKNGVTTNAMMNGTILYHTIAAEMAEIAKT